MIWYSKVSSRFCYGFYFIPTFFFAWRWLTCWWLLVSCVYLQLVIYDTRALLKILCSVFFFFFWATESTFSYKQETLVETSGIPKLLLICQSCCEKKTSWEFTYKIANKTVKKLFSNYNFTLIANDSGKYDG